MTPMDIAQHTASRLARQYADQEQHRDKPLSVDYVSADIASKIGTALFEAGYQCDDITFGDREFFALDALQDSEYPGILNS